MSQSIRLSSLSNMELGAYVHTHTVKSTASFLPRGYYGPASGIVVDENTPEPRARVIRAMKLAGYVYSRRMNFWA